MPSKREFSDFVDKAFWALLVSLVGFGVKFLSDMSISVHALNERVAVIIEKVQTNVMQINDHEKRIDKMERGVIE